MLKSLPLSRLFAYAFVLGTSFVMLGCSTQGISDSEITSRTQSSNEKEVQSLPQIKGPTKSEATTEKELALDPTVQPSPIAVVEQITSFFSKGVNPVNPVKDFGFGRDYCWELVYGQK